MIREEIHIEQYGWHLYAYLAAAPEDADEILAKVGDVGISAQELMKAERHLRYNACDGGMTYSSLTDRTSVMVVGISSSDAEALNTFSHELRHLTDDISLACGIPSKGEEVAYLTGDIALVLAASLLHIVCDCPVCRKHE